MKRFRRYLLNISLLLFSAVLALEVAGYLAPRFAPNLYGPSREVAIQSIMTQYRQFVKNSTRTFPSIIGWGPHYIGVPERGRGCAGSTNLYNYNHDTVRIFRGYKQDNVQVILVGDSYTQGAEADSEETISASMYQQAGIMSANLGRGNFSPVQALLTLTSKRQLFPNARVAVLGIMYNNIERMVNSFAGMYDPPEKIHIINALRPYMKDNKIRYFDMNAFNSVDRVEKMANKVMEEDYWAKPDQRFPYSLSLIKGVLSNDFRISIMSRRDGRFNYLYQDKYLGDNLFSLLTMYGKWAEKEDIVPIVFFIPFNLYSTTAPEYWIKKYQSRLPKNLIVKNLKTSMLDVTRFNQNSLGQCHPSHYGYWSIAEQYTAEIKKHLLPLHDILYGPAARLGYYQPYEEHSVMQLH